MNQVEMTTKVINTIKKYNLIEDGDKIVLGVSGGPDSICMLNILNDIRNDKKLHIEFDIIGYIAQVTEVAHEKEKDLDSAQQLHDCGCFCSFGFNNRQKYFRI